MTSGVRHMILGSFWFSVMSLLVKFAGRDMAPMQVVLFRGVMTLGLSAALVARAGHSPGGTRHTRHLLLVRGVVGTIALSCFYASVIRLPLAEASVVQYTNPVFTAVLAALLLGERAGWREIVAVVAGLAGVVLIARPAALFGGLTRLPVAHLAVALVGAMCSAGAYVAIRAIGRREHPQVVVLWLPLLTVPMTLPFALRTWHWPTAPQWLVLAGVGVTTQLGQLSLTKGLQRERAGRATAVGYLQIVFAALWGVLAFGERPDAWTLTGGAIILGGTLLVALRRKPAVAAATPAPADA